LLPGHGLRVISSRGIAGLVRCSGAVSELSHDVSEPIIYIDHIIEHAVVVS